MSAGGSATRLVVLGGGGHAAVVVDTCASIGVDVVGVTTQSGKGPDVLGTPVIGQDSDLAQLRAQLRLTHFIVGIGSVVGGEKQRQQVYAAGLASGLVAFSAVHPRAIVARSAMLGPGVLVCAGAVVQARTQVGENAIVNTAASIDHDCTIDPHAHIAPGAVLSGGVHVGAFALVGVGAVIRHNVRIGANATIGAGAAVVADCADGVVLAGTPARPLATRG